MTSNWYEGDSLTPNWGKFVNCKYRSKTMEPFLSSVLPNNKGRIVDFGAGTGCEAEILLNLGYDVTANEIDPNFRNIAQRRLGSNAARVNWKSSDWRCLAENMSQNSHNSGILLGNSFSVLLDPRDRKAAAREFRHPLTPNAALIIDQRDFGYIIKNKERILNNGFNYSYEIVYCGREVIGEPIRISEQKVTFGYFKRSNDKKLGEIEMYPFQGREMIELFEEVGFNYLCSYLDLDKKVQYNTQRINSEFITHLFELK